MAFSIRGYVLEKPRVGTANSPFTLSPDNVITDFSAFNTAFPSTEANPRVEYLTLVEVDGDLANAAFAWTKNEVLARFDWDGQSSRFRTLPGGPLLQVGTLSSTANTTRFKIPVPQSQDVSAYPFRLAVSTTGSGLPLTLDLVVDDAALASATPAQGHVAISQTSGSLQWNPLDLTTYSGQVVTFQKQTFFGPGTNGALGVAPRVGHPEDLVLLNPIPATTQHPLIRLGYSLWLNAVEVVNEASFSGSVVAGNVEWARDTGRLHFSAVDLASHVGSTVYYDGVVLVRNLGLTRQNCGTVQTPVALSTPPLQGSDMIFRARTTLLSSTGSVGSSRTQVVDSTQDFVALGVQVGDVLVFGTGSRRVITQVVINVLTVSPSLPSAGSLAYQVERLRIQFGQTLRVAHAGSEAPPGAGQVLLDDTGIVETSSADKALYSSTPLEVVSGDLPLERGLALRFFRTPVDPGGINAELKDVSAFYTTTAAVVMNSVIGSPYAGLPSTPLDDPSFTLAYHSVQGTGSFTGDLTRLDTVSPPATTAGYTLDLDQRQIKFAQRKTNVILPLAGITGTVTLPDTLVNPNNLVLELDQGLGFQTLTLGDEVSLEPNSGVVSFLATEGKVLLSSSASTLIGSTLTDPNQNFTSVGLVTGDFLQVTSGANQGLYTVLSVTTTTLTVGPNFTTGTTSTPYEIRRGKEVLADRYFREVDFSDPNTAIERVRPFGAVQNSPRLTVSLPDLARTQLRIGQTLFIVPTQVVNDAAFTAPSLLPSGTVEVSQTTGHLNFSAAEVSASGLVCTVKKLVERKEYRIDPVRGLIQTLERLLTKDEVLISYVPFGDGTFPTQTPIIRERCTFLVRKEVAIHPTAGSIATFNALGRTLAASPAPVVYRNGRPQDETQVSINLANSTLTFLTDDLATDAIPHGSILSPSERVYVDYYVYQALGGENTTGVSAPPIRFTSVVLKEDATSFLVSGDRTADFPAGYLLRVNAEEVYYLDTPTYDSIVDMTTVNLAFTQSFRNDAAQPKLFVTSGPLRTSSNSYFTLESDFSGTTGSVPRGMNKFRIPGDKTKNYVSGTALYFEGSGDHVGADFYLVSGSNYDSAQANTEVTLTNPTLRQYDPQGYLPGSNYDTLRKSVRPILESTATSAQTLRSPLLVRGTGPNYALFRTVEGHPGQLLASPADYTLDDSGLVVLTLPLRPLEEVSLFYTGYALRQGTVRASYTSTIVPTIQNGLAGQALTSDYTTFSPDTFFFRVETLTNYRGEVAQKYRDAAKASVPSGGPLLTHAYSQKLFQQGRPGTFFEEGALYNEDIVARSILKFYNDGVNLLEDTLQGMDGRIVGDINGRFRFDGTLGTMRANAAAAQNQIDDLIQISQYPVRINPNFSLTFLGTYTQAYLPSPTSRFYPTLRKAYGLTTGGSDTGASTGDQILDFKQSNLGGVSSSSRRSPRSTLTSKVTAGTTVIPLDAIDRQTTPVLRPAYAVGMRVTVYGVSGIDPQAEYHTITSIDGGSVTVTLDGGFTQDLPKGAKLAIAPSDSVNNDTPGYQKLYRDAYDIDANLAQGYLLYVKPFPPLDNSIPLIPIPEALIMKAPRSFEMLETVLTFNNSATAPQKFPALYGAVYDDGGDQSVAIQNPGGIREQEILIQEQAYVKSSGILQAKVTPPLQGVGGLEGTKTTLTLTAGTFSSPTPQLGDLVRITSGNNFGSPFHRVLSATANSVTVDVPFTSLELAPVSFEVTVGQTKATNLGPTVSYIPTVLTDSTAHFMTAGVIPGMTLVLMSGAYAGTRRSITAVTETTLSLSSALPDTTLGLEYRVAASLSTFDPGIGGLDSVLAAEATNLHDTQRASILAFFELVSTDILSVPASGVVSGNNTLTVTGATDFLASKVNSSHFVYIDGGVNSGMYAVSQVTSAQTLTINGTFPSNTSATVRVVSVFGVVRKTLTDLTAVIQGLDTFVVSLNLFQTKILPYPVVVPSGQDTQSFASKLELTDVQTRAGLVVVRLSTFDPSSTNGPVNRIQTILNDGDRLYDKRYTWIDTRINLEKGLLVKHSRAIEARIKAQQDTLNQLLKLLVV